MKVLGVDVFKLLWVPVHMDDPHGYGRYGVVGRILRDGMDMRKSYLVKFNVDKSIGSKIKRYAGAYGGGLLHIDGTPESFDDPVGKNFLLTGQVRRIFDSANHDITNELAFKLAFDDIPWQYVDSHFNESGGNRMVSANLSGSVSSDWSKLTDLRVEARGKGLVRFVAKEALVTGSGKLNSEQ